MKEHILIIEDEKAIQSVLYELLIEAGYLVTLADDSFLFDSIAQTEIHKNYLQPDFLHFIALFLLESLGVFMTVLVCSGAILRLKPKEILTKMS